MAIDSVRSGTDQEGTSPCLEENTQNNSGGLAADTKGAHPIAQAIAGGGVLDPPGGGEGAAPATPAEQAVSICTGVLFRESGGVGGGNGVTASDSSALQERMNPLEEDRKMRRRQVERTAARLSRVRIKRHNTEAEDLIFTSDLIGI